MNNNSGLREVTALLISDNTADIDAIKSHLEKTMGMSCRLLHCASIPRSSGFFKHKIPQVDVVLLDLSLVNSGMPREIFRQMRNIVSGVPIIVFTRPEDHDLALMVINEGAADNITKGRFSSDPYKLRDAIEFSICRHRISKDRDQENASALGRLGRRDSVMLRDQKSANIAALKQAGDESDILLQDLREESAALLREKDEVIFWISGGYSINNAA